MALFSKNWKQIIVSQGEPFQIEYLDRTFSKRSKVVFKVSDVDGTITCNGKSLTGTQNIAGSVVATGDVASATLHVSGASALHATTVTTLTASGATDFSAALSKLPAASFRSYCTLGNNGAGHVTATGVKIGDKVVMQANITDHVEATVFESTVTVNDQIQQSGTDLSAKTIVFLVLAQS